MIIGREEFRKCFSFYLNSNESKLNLKIPTTSLWRLGLCFYWMDLIK